MNPKHKHRPNLTGELSYKTAMEFVLKTLKEKKIGEATPLTEFCRQHNINYQVLLNIRNHKNGLYPSVIAKALESLGYRTIVKKEIQYKYIIKPSAKSSKKKLVAKKAGSK